MGFFDDVKEVINDSRKLDNAHLAMETSGLTEYATKKITINTSAVANVGVTINNPYVINFPFKKISFIEIMNGTTYNPRLDVFCTIVFGSKGDILTDSDSIVVRLGDTIEFDEIKKECYFYFNQSSVNCTLLFSTSMKMEVSNNVVFRPQPTRTLQQAPITCGVARLALISSAPDLRVVHLYNESATETVYVGSSSVTTLNGFPLKPQSFYSFESSGALFGITNAGTAIVRIVGLYL